MAVNDYKQVKYAVFREGKFVVEKDSILEAFKSYLKRLARGDKDLKLIAGVNLKRRQNVESYKLQIGKGLKAHKVALNLYAKKLNIVLTSDFDDIVKAVMLSKTEQTQYDVKGCKDNFLVICSDVKITV